VRAILLHVPPSIKAKLDALREQGYSTNGFIRALLQREFNKRKPATRRPRKERRA
jgi:hypothetical protein